MRRSLALLVALPGAALAQKAPECGTFPQDQPSLLCVCAPGAATGAVWGSGPYTADSDVCTAAVHAGVLGPEGGRVIANRIEGVAAHPGSEAHGVVTSDWGAYPVSFAFRGQALSASLPECGPFPADAQALSCVCPPLAPGEAGGSVWGSNPYTGDSDVCTAARHAGALGPDGGTVSLLAAPGQDAYPASEAFGVTTSEWGAYGRSFEVLR